MNGPSISLDQLLADIGNLETELRAGLEYFWEKAGLLLQDGPIRLVAPDPAQYSLAGNFFSALFLYSYYRVSIPAPRRIFYVAVNQCLRAMVTGCDNILDDEYKVTINTDLPGKAHRFRSVLDIMTADRILFELLVGHCRECALPLDMALQGSAASLHALTASGAQEASEEGGGDGRLQPEEVLRKVHHYKTGLLFQCTWAIPGIFENVPGAEGKAVLEALYRVGIGCQLLDDMVDLLADIRNRRQNFAASAVFYEESPELWSNLERAAEERLSIKDWYQRQPAFFEKIRGRAMAELAAGLRQLFLPEHQGLVEPAAKFIAGRIGVPEI